MRHFALFAASVIVAATLNAAPAYILQRADGPITIDGCLDEATWSKALPASPLRDLSGGPSEYVADIRMAYDQDFLYIGARLPTRDLRASITERDAVIYRDDDFEVFIDPTATGRHYLELELNQLGTVWDLFLTAPYSSSDCLALHDWDIKGLRSAVTLQGTLNDDRPDEGWTVEIAWPWASITGHSNHPRTGTPPPVGTVMRMNFSRVDHPAPGQERNTVWAPTHGPTIHAPAFWGRVRVSDKPVGTPETFPPTLALWVHGDNPALSPEDLRAWKVLGIDTLIIGGTDANIAKVARWAHAENLRAIAWLWALNRPDDPVALKHPEWHAVSQAGKSTFRPEDRPFVAYYQFLCPTHPGVREHLANRVRELAALDVDAIQLDYIRLPDVVLPSALWSHYGLDMSTTLPPYDFCYCARCKAAFGKEPDPADPAWHDFRLRQVAAVANTLIAAAHAAGKPCGAAVFPTPALASKMVYQDWARFNLDFAFPMTYASFYGETDAWVLERMQENRAAIKGRFPVLPGLHIPDFYGRPDDLRALIRTLKARNPAGVCLFSDEELRRILAE